MKKEEEMLHTISVKIRCGGDEESLTRKEDPNEPDGILTETKGRALKAFAAFVGAFVGSFSREIKEKAAKKNRGEIEAMDFILANEEEIIDKITISKEEIEEIAKK